MASVIGAILLLMLSIISYFLIRYFNGQDKINEKLISSIDKLSGCITGMNATVIANTLEIDHINRDREKQVEICTKNFERIEQDLK